MAAPAEPLPDLVTADDVADAWKMSKHSVLQLTRERRIGHHKFGAKSIRFRREDIDGWLADTYRPAVNP